MEEPKGWRELQQKALDETNPQRLIEIIDQLLNLLTAHERATACVRSNIGEPDAAPDGAYVTRSE